MWIVIMLTILLNIVVALSIKRAWEDSEPSLKALPQNYKNKI